MMCTLGANRQPSTTKPLRLTEMHMVVVCTWERAGAKGQVSVWKARKFRVLEASSSYNSRNHNQHWYRLAWTSVSSLSSTILGSYNRAAWCWWCSVSLHIIKGCLTKCVLPQLSTRMRRVSFFYPDTLDYQFEDCNAATEQSQPHWKPGCRHSASHGVTFDASCKASIWKPF